MNVILKVQLDVFDEQRESDESQAHSTLDGHGVDLNSHLDVFYSIYNQVPISHITTCYQQELSKKLISHLVLYTFY